jgi:hypothetical protein
MTAIGSAVGSSKSEPRPRVHPVLGFANYQCGKCLNAILVLAIEAQPNYPEQVHGLCSRCGVTVDLPVMRSECVVVES